MKKKKTNEIKSGDWRIKAVVTPAKDVPAAYPGGPSYKAGDSVSVGSIYLTS